MKVNHADKYTISHGDGNVTCLASYSNGRSILAYCDLLFDEDSHSICVHDWYVRPGVRRRRIGYNVLRKVVQEYVSAHGAPTSVAYIWDNNNRYVKDWLRRNFDAAAADTVTSSRYSCSVLGGYTMFTLDRQSLFNYCGIYLNEE